MGCAASRHHDPFVLAAEGAAAGLFVGQARASGSVLDWFLHSDRNHGGVHYIAVVTLRPILTSSTAGDAPSLSSWLSSGGDPNSIDGTGGLGSLLHTAARRNQATCIQVRGAAVRHGESMMLTLPFRSPAASESEAHPALLYRRSCLPKGPTLGCCAVGMARPCMPQRPRAPALPPACCWRAAHAQRRSGMGTLLQSWRLSQATSEPPPCSARLQD